MSSRHFRSLATAALAIASLQATAGPGLKLGYAHIGFNTRSGDLSGPPGTTPPGVRADIDDTRTLALVADLPLTEHWGLVLQAGTPPVVHFNGAGAGAALGAVGSARAWFPALLARWQPAPWGALQPYAAVGVNHSFYTDATVTDAFTTAFGGTSSRSSLKSSQGSVVKVGAEWRLDERWALDLAYARYGVRTTATLTTATPGLGDVVRTVDVKADPEVLSVMLGYRF